MLLFTHITEVVEKGLDEHMLFEAMDILSRIVLPREITGEAIEKYLRKALRTRAWRRLSPESRALMYILRNWRGRIESYILRSILKNLFLQIELFTLRGRALLFGIIQIMKNPIYELGEVLQDTKRLLTLGIFYLNNPFTYRIYG